jgi:hypothetical protein
MFAPQGLFTKQLSVAESEVAAGAHMRKRERKNVVGKIEDALDTNHGQPMCIRPYRSDEKKLDEIVKETGERKSAIVRRMIRFALSDKHERFGTNRCRERLDLLIEQGRQSEGGSDSINGRFDEILDRITSLEDDHKIASQKTSIFLRELYSMSSLSVSVLNIILTRLIELTSPGGADKKQSVLIADGTIAKLIAHAIVDLNKCRVFHGIQSEEEADDLYIARRIRGIAATRSAEPKPEHPSK